MTFSETEIPGAFVIDLERKEDERGFFARTWCQREFAERGLSGTIVQCSTSFNRRKGTLRGMHFQAAPHAETRLVRCTRGAIYDVILDLREHSATYMRWSAVDLTADGGRILYVPEGVAHGFQTLLDDTEVFYQMSEFFHPESACGVRWNDPAFGIVWPPGERIISERDQAYPDFFGMR